MIKHSANQKYTTDAVSAAVMRCLCERAGVPYQEFLNRSDILGGSTLGNISNAQVSLNTVDVGLPQLAMHSPYETAGSKDTNKQAVHYFYIMEQIEIHILEIVQFQLVKIKGTIGQLL